MTVIVFISVDLSTEQSCHKISEKEKIYLLLFLDRTIIVISIMGLITFVVSVSGIRCRLPGAVVGL